MDGRSCGPGRVPTVASADGNSAIDNGGINIPPEKHSALDGAARKMNNVDGSSEDEKFVNFCKPVSLVVKKGLQKCVTFPPSTDEARQEDSCCDAKDAPKDALVKKGLQKCVTFPPSTDEARQEDSCCDAKDVPKDAPTYQRSVSLPPTMKLISAMKGSRQKNGMASPTENRHIKWAPDVYDPPVTSVCHSVNNSYQRRSNPRKKDKYKQKQKPKGKSKKKHHNGIQNQAVQQAPGLKDGSTSSDESVPDDLDKHEILDYGISSQEAKCRGSFLRETIAKMHFSTAEAS